MIEENYISEFKEKFATIDDALKYISDSQAKSEWLQKQDQIERRKDQNESRQRMAEVERHLAHITKVLRFNIETYEFQESKLEKAGEILQKKM